MSEMRATVVGWVGEKRIAFEVSSEVYDQLANLKKRYRMSDDALLNLITQGGTRKPTERAAQAVLRQHMT